jgi:hypothetical protein
MAELATQAFKERQLQSLPEGVGVYALCDLDQIPIYVGKSKDAIRARVRRHLTSARSDVIANRQIDVWEIAWVWAWPVTDKSQISPLEAHLFEHFNKMSPLVNAAKFSKQVPINFEVPAEYRVQVMPSTLIKARLDPTLRFPRQIQHFNQLVDYILNTQDKPHLRKALKVYFDRLTRYFEGFLSVQAPKRKVKRRRLKE